MATHKPKFRKNDRHLRAFVDEVTASLVGEGRLQVPGLGTFSTCTRKATADRDACTIAMFRASKELRDHATGGPAPDIAGPHAKVVSVLVEAMQSDTGVEVPRLGHMAVVPVRGKKPKLIFHGADELNEALTGA